MSESSKVSDKKLWEWVRELTGKSETYNKRKYLHEKKEPVYAVMVVDMQERFLKYFRPELKESIIKNQIKVLRHSAENNVPALAVEFEDEGKTITEIYEEIIKNNQYDSVIKKDENAFKTISVLDKLCDWNVTDIFLMGVNASACIRNTAAGARKYGFNVATTIDVIGDDTGMERETYKTINWFYFRNMLKGDLENSVLKSLKNVQLKNNYSNTFIYSSQKSSQQEAGRVL